MKNLLKDNEPMYMFKPNCFEYDTKYELEIDGKPQIYKTCPKPKYIGPNGQSEPEIREFPKPFATFMNVLFDGDPIPEPDPSRPNIHMPRYGFGPTRPRRIPEIRETISIEAIHVAKGIVHIRKFEDPSNTSWIDMDDLVTVEQRKSIDFEKIKPGQIWRLSIDGDSRFQNTLIMILSSYGDVLRFVYQTKVIYSTDYHQIDTAEGCINLYVNSTGSMNDIDKVHLELVT